MVAYDRSHLERAVEYLGPFLTACIFTPAPRLLLTIEMPEMVLALVHSRNGFRSSFAVVP